MRTGLLRGFNFFYFGMFAIFLSFVPIYCAFRGIATSDVGSMLAVGSLLGVIAQPVWGLISDKRKSLRSVLLLLLVLSLAAGVALYRTSDAAMLYAAVALMYVLFLPTDPLAESLNVQSAARAGVTFGSVRMFGALGYAAASFFVGVFTANYGMDRLWLLFLVFGMAAAGLTLLVKDVPVTGKPVSLRELGRFFAGGQTVRFFALVLLVAVPHRMNDSFIGLYVQEAGGGVEQVGLAWAVMTLTEFIFFAVIHRFIRPGRELAAIRLAAFLYALRFALCVVLKDPSFLVGLQLLQGCTFVLFYAAAIQYLYGIVPDEWKATGQTALAATFFGISGVLGSAVGGRVMEHFGGSALYAAMAVLAMAGGAASYWTERR